MSLALGEKGQKRLVCKLNSLLNLIVNLPRAQFLSGFLSISDHYDEELISVAGFLRNLWVVNQGSWFDSFWHHSFS